MASFMHLPPELLDQIILNLTEEPPLSAKFLHEDPSNSLLRSSYHPLKNLSQACRATSELCFPSLFSAIKLDLSHIGDFLSFSKKHSLSTHVESLVLYNDPFPGTERPGGQDIWRLMVQILDSVQPCRMTLVFTPSTLAKILPYEINLTDQWAFGIPFQVLQLSIPRNQAQSSPISPEATESNNVFRLRNWTHCTFNQGSSIKGYGSYEYFLKSLPSIFDPWDHDLFHRTMEEGTFECLASLDYIAIFPIDHAQIFCMCLDNMRALKCLRVQLAPTLRNNVLDDPAALGKCSQGDLWQEFESNYVTLAQYLYATWQHRPTSLEKFVSLDYTNPSLREMIDRLVGHYLVRRGSEFVPGTWTRQAFAGEVE